MSSTTEKRANNAKQCERIVKLLAQAKEEAKGLPQEGKALQQQIAKVLETAKTSAQHFATIAELYRLAEIRAMNGSV